MDAQIAIQRATIATIGLFDAVADDIFDAPIDLDRVSAILVSKHHLMIVAVRRGQIIAQCRGLVVLSSDSSDALYIDSIGVSGAFQRRGIGTRMIDELVCWGREIGCGSAWMLTECDNIAARALYVGRGFAASACMMFDRDLQEPDRAFDR